MKPSCRVQPARSFAVISPGGVVERVCEWCEHLKQNTYCQNPEQRKVNRRYLCRDCHEAILKVILDDYRLQVEAGIPRGERMVKYPIRVGGEDLLRDTRAGIARINAEMDRHELSA